MDDQGNNSKIFVIIISIIVIALIVIGCIFTWKIIQKGQESSACFYEVEQFQIVASERLQED